MSVVPLAPGRADALRGLELTYERGDATSPAFRTSSRTRVLAPGTDLERAAAALLGWQVQSGVGIRVATSDPVIRVGTVAELRIGFVVHAPCRVVAVIDEPDRRGFSYGTLPGHPESGEESFHLRRRADGRVEFTVAAFSRHATWFARTGGPLTRLAQRAIAARYLRTLDR